MTELVEPIPGPGSAPTRSGFPAALVLGPTAFDGPGGPDLAATIADRLAAVAERRGYPLHTAVAFNALYWGYDWWGEDDHGRYDDQALAALPDVGVRIDKPGNEVDALPVGAFTWLAVGNAHPLWVEVVGKDGRPAGGEDGALPPELSGGPSGAEVNEAWVVDPHLFGHEDRYDRKLVDWARAGRLGSHGLVEVRSRYETTTAANEPDVAFFVRWLVATAAEALASGALGASLTERPDPATATGRERLTGALVAALGAIDDALARSERFRRWGDYWVPAAWVDEVDDRPNFPFGRHDLEAILSSIARAGRGPSAAWATLGPRLEDLADRLVETARRRGGDHLAPADPLGTTDWLRRVIVSARWLGDQVVERNGLVVAGGEARYVRADDQWPWGGSWLSAPMPARSSPLWGLPPDESMWLGSTGLDALLPEPDDGDSGAEEKQDSDDTEDAEDRSRFDEGWAPGDDTRGAGVRPDSDLIVGNDATNNGDDGAGPPAIEAEIEDTVVEAMVTLRATDIDHGTLPLPERFGWIGDLLDAGETVHLRLQHEGLLDDDQRRQTLIAREGATVDGLEWPMDFTVGIRLHLAAVVRLPTLYASTRRITDVDGTRFLCDPAGLGTVDGGKRLTLAALAIDALRRAGRPTYGSRRATAAQIADALFGTDAPAVLVGAVRMALDTLVGKGRLGRAGSEYTIADTADDPTRERMRPAGYPAPNPGTGEVRIHVVHGFLRCLAHGWVASAEKRSEYLELTGRALPAGYTWVSEHVRGNDIEAVRAALDGAETPDGPLTGVRLDQLMEERFYR